jgi:hypothetical protein
MILTLALFVIGLSLGTFAHEAGHALVVWRLRFEIRLISVGIGPALVRLRLGQAWLIIRALPVTGVVKMLPVLTERRIALAVFLIGGVLGNVALFAALGIASVVIPNVSDSLKPVAFAQVFMIVVNLFPAPAKRSGLGTDGRQLLRLLFRRRTKDIFKLRDALLRQMVPDGAPLPDQSADTAEILYQYCRADLFTHPWVQRDAAEVMPRVLRRNHLPNAEKALVLNFLVSIELMFGGGGLSARCLDAWSREALAIAPTSAQRAQRGALLIALGRTDDGTTLLLELLSEPINTTADVLVRAFLAMAARGQGNSDDARRWNDEARVTMVSTNLNRIRPVVDRLGTLTPGFLT